MLKIYNTLTRKKEVFKPRTGKKVRLFVCGVTPYDFSHIGHARTYLAFDMIAKYLKEQGYAVFYLQNITDIDDKIIIRARSQKIAPKKLAERFEKEYLKDMKSLRIDSVTKYARATDHIKEIITQIEKLLKAGLAYQIKDGVYYNIKKFKNYGQLSQRTAEGAEDAVSRIDEDKEKKNKGDFCLWKLAPHRTEGSGAGVFEPSWPSPFGIGRPGWHIEDTALAEKFLGAQYDMHGGARDLIFPHHEAEIAQMEAISQKPPMAKYWLHTGFLTVKGSKMAKSAGNFITIQDFLKQHSARILRFLVIKNHYRSPIDYTENSCLQAEKELARIDEFITKIRNPKFEIRNKSKIQISKFETSFKTVMEDDFNTPKAIAVIFELITKGNSLIDKNLLSKNEAKEILEFFKKIDRFLGFLFWPKFKETIPQVVLGLAKHREQYRKEGQWQKADEIRKQIQKMGWQIEDTNEGPKLKRAES